jgi:hypothetical protein
VTKERQNLGLINRPIDYGCEDRKEVVELRANIDAIRQVLTPSLKKTRSSPPTPLQNKPFSQEMHLKIPLLCRALKPPNPVQRVEFSMSPRGVTILNHYILSSSETEVNVGIKS